MPAEARGTSDAFRTLVARILGRRAETSRKVRKQTPEAMRIEAAIDMHEFGVRLYRQRMRREHPLANRDQIDSMVRAWLAEPPRAGHMRLPSRERDRGIH
jgi:hypothetical protein